MKRIVREVDGYIGKCDRRGRTKFCRRNVAIDEDEGREEDALTMNRFEIQETVNKDCSRNICVSENLVNLSERVLTNSENKVLFMG